MAGPEILKELEAVQRVARAASGWDFPDLGIVSPAELPWNYREVIAPLLVHAVRAVDLGTGGGERLQELLENRSGDVFATEEWVVNAPVARDRLAPLGVPVVRCSSLCLPFADASFDLILSRHEAIDPDEIARALRPDGHFVTQQVEAENWPELRKFFPRATVFEDHFVTYGRRLDKLEFDLERTERHSYDVHFPTLASLVYMLVRAVETIPDFDVTNDLDALLELEDELRTPEGIRLTEGRYLIVACKAP